jgi:predicted TIM-barrel fold metal-dependent hydrolase
MIINCHCHIFDLKCVPLEFRNRFVLNLKNPIHKFVHRLLKLFFLPESKPAQFLGIAEKSILEIAQKLVQEMDEAGIDIATPLMMDMEYNPVFEGDLKDFQTQILETAKAVKAINTQYGKTRMMPFIAADPRRPDIYRIVTEALESRVFKGVKIYPVMGYDPGDDRLNGIYEYCVDNDIPVTTHCSYFGIPGFHKYFHMADPQLWEKVLNKFPALTLNLAHNDFTGKSWQPKIERLIKTYDNVYTDLSYNIEMWFMPRRYFKNVKRMLNADKIKDRVLYGTDWYMGRFLWDETSYLKWFQKNAKRIFWCRIKFTDKEWKRLTEDNPKRFLGL